MGSPMMVGGLMIEGLRLMVIGMGIVYAFLLLLVGVLRVLSLGVQRWAPQALAASPSEAPAGTGPALPRGQAAAPPTLPGEILAVIAAAVSRYRHDHPAQGIDSAGDGSPRPPA
jgi:oxaloacetate decarboxylase gamma subunit